MSDQINLDENNLCITEDVFEKFQAESMYEAEEIITLHADAPPNENIIITEVGEVKHYTELTNNQIVDSGLEPAPEEISYSKPDRSSNIDTGDNGSLITEQVFDYLVDECQLHQSTERDEDRADLHHDTIDIISINETDGDKSTADFASNNLDVTYQDNVDIVASEVVIDSINETVEIPNIAAEVNITDEILNKVNVTPNEPQSKRTGRKKKNTQYSHIGSNIGLKSSLSNEINSEDVYYKESKPHPRRRGRKKENLESMNIITSFEKQIVANDSLTNESHQIVDNISENSNLDNKHKSYINAHQNRKQRGRKKRNVQHSEMNTDTKKRFENNLVKNKDEVCSVQLHKTPVKRGRRPKHFQNNVINSCDESTDVGVQDASESPKTSETDSPVKSIDVSLATNNAKPRKRGRPKSKQVNEQVSIESNLNTNSDNVHNEAELQSEVVDINNIPLSKLSKKIKQSEDKDKILCNVNESSENDLSCDSFKTLTRDQGSITKIKSSSKRGRPKKVNTITPVKIEEPINKANNSQEFNATENQANESTITINQTEETFTTNESLAVAESVEDKLEVLFKDDKQSESAFDIDDNDDISLSNLKKTLETLDNDISQDMKIAEMENKESITKSINECNKTNLDDTSDKKSSKMPVIDIETNIDKPVSDVVVDTKITDSNENKNDVSEESLLVEDTSKRPSRRKIKQNLHYDEESDEDPFANIELSDDEPKRGKKSGKYYSDDEYIPGKKRGIRTLSSDSLDSEFEDEEPIKHKRKRYTKRSDSSQNKSPRKKGKKTSECLEQETDVTKQHPKDLDQNIDANATPSKCLHQNRNISTIPPNSDDDIEVCLKPTVIKTNDESNGKPAWGTTHEFENFIAKKIQGTNLKIKKVTSVELSTAIAPLEIPTLDANDVKKTVEMCSQTIAVQKSTASVQTSPPYDLPMKKNVVLTKDQSIKACEFLNGIVKTTAELGVLMTQKSEDFMKKKINTDNVTDTFKMDYCVRKSFLLFKLAKHNLMQMEEDLANQYEQFLQNNNLQTCREEPTRVAATAIVGNSDSDCEIVEEPEVQLIKKEKPKFNPKTVFLNKELSIKIAKKQTEDKKLNIKGRHTVWINDSVVLKKVTPTQSFLAQDSRNKKPPDCNSIIGRIVYDFFKAHNRLTALSVCAPFVTTEWVSMEQTYVCNYFVNKPEDFSTRHDYTESTGDFISNSESTDNFPEVNGNAKCNSTTTTTSPNTLFSLCTFALQNHLNLKCNKCTKVMKKSDGIIIYGNASKTLSLLQLCLNTLNSSSYENFHDRKSSNVKSILPLKTLCHKKIVDIFEQNVRPITRINNSFNIKFESYQKEKRIVSDPKMPLYSDSINCFEPNSSNLPFKAITTRNGIKSLFTLCVELIQRKQNSKSTQQQLGKTIYMPKSLKYLTLKNITHIMNYPVKVSDTLQDRNIFEEKVATPLHVKSLGNICLEVILPLLNKKPPHRTSTEGVTINSVNTMSEEAFLNIEESAFEDNCEYFAEETNLFENDLETEYDLDENSCSDLTEDSSWITQVQMRELKSCFDSIHTNNTDKNVQNKTNADVINNATVMVNIKIEPQDEFSENILDSSIVKTEPTQVFDELSIVLENVTTKAEFQDCPENNDPPIADSIIQRKGSISCDVDAFESFVSSNKMIANANSSYSLTEEIFSQSNLRIRRQFEPDSDDENDMSMSLLIPQTSKPLPVDNVKNTLMQSSSDENDSRDTINKKKNDKRKKKTKKVEIKQNNKDSPNISKNKVLLNNEVAVLTRRMRERIRQEEKKIESSDSENEGRSLRPRPEKNNQDEHLKGKQKSSKKKYEENEIQCNNVDSTEQVGSDKNVTRNDNSTPVLEFTGFSAVDQNEISNYQKYVKDVYEKILPKCDLNKSNLEQTNKTAVKTTSDKNEALSTDVENNTTLDDQLLTVVNSDEPVEYLECEPTLPIFDQDDFTKKGRSKKKGKIILENRTEPELNADVVPGEKKSLSNNGEPDKTVHTVQVIDRHGWKCYPIDANDKKIYEQCHIILDKLPESFVEMYFKYQDITDKSKEDEEVDRLTNLHSLNRIPNSKDAKNRTKTKEKNEEEKMNPEQIMSDGSRAPTPVSDHYHELTPSEDEGANAEEELPTPVPKHTENNMAKNSLMDDNESEPESASVADITIKQEPKDQSVPKKTRREPKPKIKLEQPADNQDLMLTADKMMNKELTMLHAPVVLNENIPEVPVEKPNTRSKQKSGTKSQSNRDNVKAEDDSSSEEEKQWVNTKEKLLKRMEKKQETALADDAKRAKLVSEFIERRGEGSEPRKKARRRSRKSKKFLEKQKQLRVLSKELLGDSSDGMHLGKRYRQVYSKGRRNIRKVLDKKSLAKSTVIANMEEFERKRRLSMKQAKLREVLGCEEGVNVLVINDELCLEYDFEQHRPVVTVHPFFTKIMKAHQYEGVKFMWDACFESLSQVSSGHSGGGCILAHCMGLGKTLQVLALLHTVLTHPGVGIKRVLVCCPLSTVLNWVDEIHKWIGPVTNKIKVFELSKLKKTYERAYQLEDWYSGGGIFIIGYELFRSLSTIDAELDDVRPTIVNKIRTALLDPGPDIVICDEGHLLKNDYSVLAVAMNRVVTKRRIVLTGTPMQNNLREYYCMVNFVKPNLLGTYTEYSNRFENPIMNGTHRDSSEEDIKLMKARTHILHKVLEGCLQRQEASVLYPYLPKKNEYTVFISLTKCQWDLYKHYLNHYGNKTKQNQIFKDFHILQKIWSHPQVLHNFQMRARDQLLAQVKAEEKLEDDLAREELAAAGEDIKPTEAAQEMWWLPYLEGGAMLDSLDASNKFVVVFRILDECIKLGDKVLIFSTSLFTMDALEYFLRKINKWSLGQEYYRLDGSVPAEVRQKWCREFNAEHNLKTKLFLISTRAGSLGLNMTAANRVIILDTSWNPAHDIQSIFRVYRFGQKKDCYIYRLVALGTMEQKIYERSVTKQAVACRVVDEQQIDRHYNMAELTELYRYDEAGAGVACGVAAGVRDVALLRVARLRALHAVHEHDSLLRASEPALPEHERHAAWLQFQQEHHHKQMQNDLDASIAKAKRTYKMMNIKTEPGTSAMWPSEENVEDPEFKPDEPRSKRGRKSIDTKEKEQNEISLDPETEKAIVTKIAQILLQHKFHNKDATLAVPQLVTNVRRIVSTGRFDESKCDPLTASIAKVLLQRDISIPEVTDIVCESVNQTMTNENDDIEKSIDKPEDNSHSITKNVKAPRVGKYKPGPKCKKGYVYDEEPSTSKTVKVECDSDVRTKRKAAIAAEKLFDTVVDDKVIDVDDDYERSDTDTATEDITEEYSEKTHETKNTKEKRIKPVKTVELLFRKEPPKDKETAPKKGPLRIKETKQINKENASRNTSAKQKYKGTETNSKGNSSKDDGCSILLSDDETPEESVPLPLSLLENDNFIKIVAHTYLAGNPMLDEDAATLAARYSTYKALKEAESTGKDITNGPIYDIAIKVLGKEVMRKIQKSSGTVKDTPKTSANEEVLPNNSTQDFDRTISILEKRRQSKKPSSQHTPSNDTPSPVSMASPGMSIRVEEGIPTIVGQPQPASVVPVGLFRTTVNLAADEDTRQDSLGDECILPDDDVRLVTDPPAIVPVVPRQPSPEPISIVPDPTFSRKRSQPLILRKVQADGHANTIPESPAKMSIVTSAAQFVTQTLTHTPVHVTPRPTLTTTTPVYLDATSVQTPMPETNIPIRPEVRPIQASLQAHNTPIYLEARSIQAPMQATNTQITPTTHTSLATAIATTVNTDNATQNMAPASNLRSVPNVTICLDSDEEDETPAPSKTVLTATRATPTKVTTVDPSTIILTKTPAEVMPALTNVKPTITVDGKANSQIRYIMIPAANVAKMNPPLVPVSMSQIPTSHFLPKPQPNSTVVSTNTSMDTTAAAASKKLVFKASDLFRLDKSGRIELLNPGASATPQLQTNISEADAIQTSVNTKQDANVTRTPSNTKQDANITRTSVNAKQDANITRTSLSTKQNASEASNKLNILNKNLQERGRSSSSSSNDSSDPLSILKDVVHIQADTYESQKSSNKITSNVKKTFSNKPSKDSIFCNIAPKDVSQSAMSSATSKSTTVQRIEAKSSTNKHSLLMPKAAVSQSTSNSTAKVPAKARVETKTSLHKPDITAMKQKLMERLNAGKGKSQTEVVMDCVDLTDAPVSDTSLNKKTIDLTSRYVEQTVVVKKITPASAASSSKNIASSSKSPSRLPEPKITSRPSVPVQKNVNDLKKRTSAPVEVTAPKKKRIDKPMTLKDFDIDDIDDIIELE